jgi:hypothetical protein
MSTSHLTDAPLTKLERQNLQASTSRFFREHLSAAMTGTIVLASLIFIGTTQLWKWFVPVGSPRDYIIPILLAGIAVGAYACRSIWVDAYKALQPLPDGPTPAERDLAGGVAKVLTVDVSRVVEIEEYEDEGAGFLLELADGRVLAVVSQDLYEFTHDAELEEGEEDNRDAFPQTRIEYRYAPHSGLHLDIRGVGKPLKPIGLAKTDKHHFVKSGRKGPRRFIGAEDGTFYEGTLEEVLARLKYTLKPLPTRDAEDG